MNSCIVYYITMSKSSGELGDIRVEIQQGNIAGSFTDDNKIWSFPTLIYKNSKNKVINYTVKVSLLNEKNESVPINIDYLGRPAPNLENYKGVITIESLQEGGKIRDVEPTNITAGKNIGKKNATNCISQAFKEAYSKYITQKKKTENTNDDTNITFPCPPPQLVQPADKTPSSTWKDYTNIAIQRKLDGLRVVVCYNENEVYTYSRTSEIYTGFNNIKMAMKELYESEEFKKLYTAFRTQYSQYIVDSVPEFHILNYNIKDLLPYFDGEMYKYGVPLNIISGQVRGDTDAKEELELHLYDCFFIDMPEISFEIRNNFLNNVFPLIKSNLIKRVETIIVNSREEVDKLYKQFVEEKYEGCIIRKMNAKYEFSFNSRHSSNILKIKPLYSDEFEVTNYLSGFKGKDVDAIIWTCRTDNGEEFNVVPKMSLENRKKIFLYLQNNVGTFEKYFKGKKLTIEYAGLSDKTQKPLLAKAVTFRTYEEGNDEIAEIFAKMEIKE